MANGFNWQFNTSQNQDPATIASKGLMYRPTIGAGPMPTGMQGTDGRSYTRNVTDDELVENRLTGLLSRDNPYIQQARQQAIRQAAGRGLGNSSIAAGNAQAAAIDRALPIAQADANAFRDAAGQNLDVMTQNLLQDRQIGNEQILANKNLAASASAEANRFRIAELDARNRLQLQRENLAFSGEQAGLDRQHDFARAYQGFQFQDQLATNDTFRQDWLSGNEFNRGMNMLYANTTMQTMADLFGYVAMDSWTNPDVADPQAFNGFMEFMTQQFPQFFGSMFDGMMGGFG